MSVFILGALGQFYSIWYKKRSAADVDRELSAAIVDLNIMDNPNGIYWSDRKEVWVTTKKYSNGRRTDFKDYEWVCLLRLEGFMMWELICFFPFGRGEACGYGD